MKLNRYLLFGASLTCLPVTSLFAGPQTEDIKVTAVVRVIDDGDEAAKDSKDPKESKEEKAEDGQKERKTLRLQLNKGPVVLMKRLALSVDESDKADKDTENASKEDKEGGDKAEAAAPKIWLGIGLKEIEGDLATYLGSSEGVFIESIFPDSPAEAAKLQEGDVVIAFEGNKVIGPADLVDALRAVKAVDSDEKNDSKAATYPNVTLSILRRGQEVKVELTPRERPENLKISQAGESDQLLEGANIFKFSPPEGFKRNLVKPYAKMKSSIAVVVNEDGQEYIARIERDGDGPAKIIVTKDKKEEELREDQLDQLPEKVREAIKKALKAEHTFEFKDSGNESSDSEEAKSKDQVLSDVREQLEKAMRQVGGGKIDIELKGLTESLKNLGEGHVIIIDPAKLHDVAKMSEDAKTMAKKLAEARAAQARGFSTMPEQVKELKKQVEDLRKQVEELRDELKASKK